MFLANRNHRQNIKITIGEFEHDQNGAEEHGQHVIVKRMHRSESDELDGGDEE